MPNLAEQVRSGEFAALLGWLRDNVHSHGRRFTSGQLCERITGRPLSHEPLVRYLNDKLRPIYGLPPAA
jgi:carboxypeptidase Taq